MIRTRRVRATAVMGTLAVAGGLGLTTWAAPATAGSYGSDCDLPQVKAVPASSANAAPATHNDTARVAEGREVIIDVLANDRDPNAGDHLSLIDTSRPSAGHACAINDHEVAYYSYGAPASGTDTFSYSMTDGDYYRTATVTVTVSPTATATPTVTTRLVTSNGRVVRKGEVTVTNPDAVHTIVFRAGAVGAAEQDIHRTIEAGGTTVVATSRSRLDYETVAYGGLADSQDTIGLVRGRIDTTTAAVNATEVPAESPDDQPVWSSEVNLDLCGGYVRNGTVNTPNAAPRPVDDTATISAGAPAYVDVAANDTDPDGDQVFPVSTAVVGQNTGSFIACVSEGKVYVLSNNHYAAAGTDPLTYTVTDGDRIRSSTIRITTEPIEFTTPTVTRRIQLSNGRVTRKAQVTVTNPDPVHKIQFFAGAQPGPYDIRRTVLPGATTVIDTSRTRLFFDTEATIGDGYEVDTYGVQSGRIDTVSGVVSPVSDPR